MSHVYSILNCGKCLGQVVPDGTILEADSSREIEIGQIVAVVVRADGAFAGLGRRLGGDGLLGVTKIFLGAESSASGETVYHFGQLNPPVVAPVPASALQAMHLIIGGEVSEDNSDTMTSDDLAALELLGPFFRGSGPWQPVNPQWRPPEHNQ